MHTLITNECSYLRFFKLGLSAIALASLAACGQGISVGTESTTGTDASNQADVSASKSLSSNSSAKVSTNVSAAQVIAPALRAVVDVAAIDLPAYVRSVKYEGGSILPLERALATQGFNGNAITDQQVEQAKALQLRLSKYVESEPVSVFAADKLLSCTELVVARDYQAAKDCYTEFYVHSYTAAAMLAVGWSQKTPGIKGESLDLISKERSFPAKALSTWAAGAVAITKFTDTHQAAWVKGLDGQVLSGPDEARLEIARRLFSTPLDNIQASIEVPKGLTPVVSNGELNGPLEVFLPERNEYISQTEKGLVVSRNGSVWHGDGFISGGKVDVSLESSVSAGMDRKTSVSSSQSEKNGSSSRAGANLK